VTIRELPARFINWAVNVGKTVRQTVCVKAGACVVARVRRPSWRGEQGHRKKGGKLQ